MHFEILLRKGKNVTQAAKKICDVCMMQYQYAWHKTQAFSGNFHVKDTLRSGRPITRQKSMKSREKIEQDWRISSHDIGKKLNIDHKIIFEPFEKD